MPEHKLLLGNEAIVQGALEAGVSIATTYPGTPASEIGDTFARLRPEGVYFEYSVNEKVATEIAIAASLCGLRSMVSMKHVGLNVAADAFVTFAYIGTRGGCVVVTADDPSCHSSQNEQDNRYYARLANVPMLEPSSPGEAKSMVKEAFALSELVELPVLLRTTTRVSHARGVVEIEKTKKPSTKGTFERDPFRFSVVPAVARARHKVLLEQMEKTRQWAERSSFNRIMPGKGMGIVTSGISYAYVMDALAEMGAKLPVLKLGVTNPLPTSLCERFLRQVDSVLVVEELEPYLEEHIKVIAHRRQVKILGKGTGHLPRLYELTPTLVREAIERGLGGPLGQREQRMDIDIKAPSRPSTLCPGCPHRATYYAVRSACKDAIYPNDIGCYALGLEPPLSTSDLLICMGSSVGTAGGFSQFQDKPVVAFIGDSTFFHAGIPALINAVHNRHPFLLIVLDNRTTAMTGHQPHPGLPLDGMGRKAPAISIEDLARACGVPSVRTVDPYNIKKTTDVIREAMKRNEVSVIVSRHPCTLIELRERRERGEAIVPYRVTESCQQCGICTQRLGCPAFYVIGEEVKIDPKLCVGCGVCAQICPAHAIERCEDITTGKGEEYG